MANSRPVDALPSFGGKFLDDKRLLLFNCVGAGGYGKVYRAIATSPSKNGRYRAVKCLRRETPGTSCANREFQLQSIVHEHPNIVTLHKVIVDKNHMFAIFDYYPGGDLFNAITRQRLYHKNNELISRVFLQILDAVKFCHGLGIYHRDLKPDNILLSKDGTSVYLGDFGLATRNSVSTTFQCGSSLYMAPEVLNPDASNGDGYVSAAADIWSLGVILANLCTSCSPWLKADITDECFYAFLHDQNFLLSILPISTPANELLKSIFAINPHSRISLDDIRLAIDGITSYYMSDENLSSSVKIVEQAVNPEPVLPFKDVPLDTDFTSEKSIHVQLVATKKDTMPCDDSYPPDLDSLPSIHDALGKANDVRRIGFLHRNDGYYGDSDESEEPITPGLTPVEGGEDVDVLALDHEPLADGRGSAIAFLMKKLAEKVVEGHGVHNGNLKHRRLARSWLSKTMPEEALKRLKGLSINTAV